MHPPTPSSEEIGCASEGEDPRGRAAEKERRLTQQAAVDEEEGEEGKGGGDMRHSHSESYIQGE